MMYAYWFLEIICHHLIRYNRTARWGSVFWDVYFELRAQNIVPRLVCGSEQIDPKRFNEMLADSADSAEPASKKRKV